MKVLLSIKPQFAKKIFDGSKKYEYRRAIFGNRNIEKVIVYVSSPVKTIVGEFEIEEIICDDVKELWEKTQSHSGISKKYFFDYFSDKSEGYAIKIKSSTKYDTPLSLDTISVSTPPQSFMYI